MPSLKPHAIGVDEDLQEGYVLSFSSLFVCFRFLILHSRAPLEIQTEMMDQLNFILSETLLGGATMYLGL